MTPLDSADGFEYRAPQVCEIVGITYRQLDYWARTGLVRPSIETAYGSGTQRRYSFEDLVELRLVGFMLDSGRTLGTIRIALDVYRKAKNRLGSGLGLYLIWSPEHGWTAIEMTDIEVGSLTLVTIVSIDWIRLVVEAAIFDSGRSKLAAV
jgi:DNA-binding transcriptional MerR regulator